MSFGAGFASPAIPKREGPWATSLARAWVRIYTRGLPKEPRANRLAELDSDFFEQEREARNDGRSEAALSLHILWRVVMGMPSDLSWRLEEGRPAAALRVLGAAIVARGIASAGWTVRRGMPGVTWLLAGGYALVGLVLLATLALAGDRPAGERAWGGVVLLVAGLLIAAGFWLATRHRKTAVGLALAGCVPFGLAFSATIVIPAASLVALACVVVKARSTAI
ncbi:MAG: hypothetical protein AB7T37_04015 [Dehalococcoidia bacterium]